jgi:peroxiredoxin family protein
MAGLFIICLSGSLEKLQFAGMTASVAAACGRPVTVFLSMNALKHFLKSPHGDAAPEGEFGRAMREKNVPPYAKLFDQAVDLGDAAIYACSMAMDVLKVEESDLAAHVKGAMGLTKFLSDAEDGQLVTF